MANRPRSTISGKPRSQHPGDPGTARIRTRCRIWWPSCCRPATNICTIFIRGAIRNNPEQAAEILRGADEVDNSAEAYAEFDYRLHHQLSFASGNPIYALILNGFKGLYSRVGRYYFSDKQARETADAYYKTLLGLAETKNHEAVFMTVRQYGIESGKLVDRLRQDMPSNLCDN